MNILQLISGDLGQGGAERLVLDLSEAQANLGHDVTICCFRSPNSTAKDRIPIGVKFHSLFKKPGVDLFFPIRLAMFIHQGSYNAIYCHLNVFLYLILSLCTIKNSKFFLTIHSSPEREETRQWVRYIRTLFVKADKLTLIAISAQIGHNTKVLYNLKGEVPVIYNGRKQESVSESFRNVKVEFENYKNNNNSLIFVAVGRLMRPKNYDLMIEAFRKLQDLNVILVVIGRDENDFINRHKNIISRNVHFIGEKHNVYDYLSCADCFVMSSIYEGLPISILEAYSAGLPVISTPVGGIPDIVTDGVNGFLSGESRLKSVNNGESRLTSVNEGENGLSVEEFITAIQRFLDADEATIQKMRETNRQLFADRFDIRQTAQQYLELYNSVTPLTPNPS